MLRVIAVTVLAASLPSCEQDTPWILRMHSTDGSSFVAARLMTLKMCEQVKLVWERSCVWKDFQQTLILDCRSDIPEGGRMTCEKS